MWFEPATVEAVRDAFPEWMALLFAVLSYLGSVWFVAPVVVLAFWFVDRRRFAPWLGIVMGGYALMVGIKSVFAVSRPGVGPAIEPAALPTVAGLFYAPLVEVHTPAFPSGHALAAVVVWGMFALESDVGRRRDRLVVAGLIPILVAFSRVAVGVHYPIDVVVGLGVGVTYLVVAFAVVRRIDDRATAAFGLAATVGVVALAVSAEPDAATLLGGAVGALVAWRLATPPRDPWPRTPTGAGLAVAGVGSLGLVALVLTVTDGLLARWIVGFVAAATVVSLPAFVPSRITRRSSTEPEPAR
ncbi:phosphatase PAP2 family protein [Natrialbaceae archaeon AArc-T1-2]|uniref:phosphatase PAP2 family protein n=1 Tax=Natrialbaceae archaeon AArc-T1-2 TaxID=3053904 RepID=UPI00255B0067|nr:phosphatase PAP2 family protein [Natrialbaceae archaeon AArc-T1-2]WIV65639.1 phosphatase PAP2 family protein [Natrialbaceae archaeon AArc-T1-2]